MKIREVQIVAPHRALLADGEIPDAPKSGEILVKTECTYISAGTELSIYTALEGLVHQPGAWCEYPWKAGYANVGTVLAAGEGVTRLKVGDRVFTYGGHASHFVYNAIGSMAIRVPDDLPSDLAAASRMAGVASSALVPLERHSASPLVLVLGLGAVGNYAAQLYQAVGAVVVGVDPLPERRALAERCGVRHTLVGGDLEAVRRQLDELDPTDGRLTGFADLVVEATGATRLIPDALALTANGGQTVLLGTPRASLPGDVRDALAEIHNRNLVVRGVMEWALPAYPVGNTFNQPNFVVGVGSLYAKQATVFQWMRDGRLRVEPVVSHRMTPEKIADAYEGLLNRPSEFTGVVLDWR